MIGELWRAKVSRIKAGRPYVVIPRLTGKDHEYGPLDIVEGPWTAGLETEETAGGGGDASFAAHAHVLGAELAAGDRVLVGFLEGRRDDPVIIGRLV